MAEKRNGFEWGSQWYGIPKKASYLQTEERAQVEIIYHELMARFVGRQMGSFNRLSEKDGPGVTGSIINARSEVFQGNIKALEAEVWEEALERYRAKRESELDETTGLFNKNAFAAKYEEELKKFNKQESGDGEAEEVEENEVMVFMHFDIDFFRQINETIKHQAADLVLMKMAEKIKSRIRPFDVAARVGGDEFEILFTHIDEQKVLEVVETVMSIIGEVDWMPGEKLSVSAGVHVIRKGTNPYFASEKDKTDTGAYISKQRGRDGFTLIEDKEYTFYKHDRENNRFVAGKDSSGLLKDFRVTLANCIHEVEASLQRSIETIYLFFEEEREHKKGVTVSLAEYMNKFYHVDSGDINDLTLKQIAELLFMARNATKLDKTS
jgi:diguanylate cyclase (GGDEF)-like protein